MTTSTVRSLMEPSLQRGTNSTRARHGDPHGWIVRFDLCHLVITCDPQRGHIPEPSRGAHGPTHVGMAQTWEKVDIMLSGWVHFSRPFLYLFISTNNSGTRLLAARSWPNMPSAELQNVSSPKCGIYQNHPRLKPSFQLGLSLTPADLECIL